MPFWNELYAFSPATGAHGKNLLSPSPDTGAPDFHMTRFNARKTVATLAFVTVMAAAAIASAASLSPTHWVATWTASPQANWGPGFVLPSNTPSAISNRTVRQVAAVSLGGRRLRIELSNAYGKTPVVVHNVHMARSAGGSRIVPGTDRAVTFGGKPFAVVPPGAPVLSDPVGLDVPALGEVAVSLYLPGDTPIDTIHWDARQTAYLADGDSTAAPSFDGGSTLPTRVLLSEILVDSPPLASAVVAFGDSITDGNGSTVDSNRRWPDFLAHRLAAHDVAVLNAGISGGRILSDGMGVSALARFDRDVLAQPGARSVIVLLGINDISWPGSTFAPDEPRVTAGRVIDGYRQLIARGHAHSLKVFGATLTPFEGALENSPILGYFDPAKEEVRQAVNQWIRTGGEFDAVIDFDAAVRDPAHPARFAPRYDSGDHLHPGDAGYRAMAEAIDPSLF